MIAFILDTDTESSDIPDAVALETIERLAAEQSAALRSATASGERDEARIDEVATTLNIPQPY